MPFYWRQKGDLLEANALQDDCIAQASDDQLDSMALAILALQDHWMAQDAVIRGLIAHLTGSALQEDIDLVMQRLGEGHGARFEFECYDTGHLFNLAIALEKRRYEPPLFIQFVLGIPGGIGAELDQLLHLLRTAQRLFGQDLEWSVLAAGRHQMAMCTHAALLGGNVRVGLEDSLYIGPGQLARSNAEQVAKICRILREHALEPATPAEARARLKLKGADRVRL